VPRSRLIVLGGVAAALALCGAADASWATGGSGNGASRASAVPTVAAPSHSIAAYPNVTVSWPAVTVGGGAVSYTVRRYSEAGVLQPIGAGCSGTLATNGCTENAVPLGRWQYTVQATRANWLGSESARSATAEIAAAPTGVTCPNCHVHGSTTYVNAANAAAVQLRATFASTSLATDTAKVSLTDGSGNAVSTTAAAPAGSGSVSFPALSTSTLVDGAVTAGVGVTANTGDLSPITSLALVRDTVAPAAADVGGSNGGTAKTADDGDTLTYTFSEQVDPGTVKSGWTGAATTVSLVFTNTNARDTIAVTGANLGTVDTQTNYVKANLTCGSSTMTMSGSTVAVTLGGCTPASAQRKNTKNSAFTWTPSASVTDLAGNPMSTATVTESGGSQVNF
jgi:chitinase